MEERPLSLPAVIAARLRAFARRRAAVSCLAGSAEALLVFGCGVVAVALVLYVWRAPLLGRTILSAALYAAAACWLLARSLAPLLRRPALQKTALEFEAAAKGRFQERISSAIELSQSGPEPGVSSWMKRQTISLAAEEIQAADPRALVDVAPAAMRWRSVAVTGAVIAVLLLVPGFGPRAWLALNPYGSTAPLSSIRLAVTPGSCRVKMGTPLEVQVTANAPLDEARLAVTWQDGFKETVLLSRAASNVFTLRLPPLQQGLTYTIEASDAEAGPYRVKVDVPPRLARMRLEIRPPAYTGWSNRFVEGGNADILQGSTVRLGIECSGEPVHTAELVAEGEPPRLFRVEKQAVTLQLEPTNTIAYQVRLKGINGLASEPSPRWILRLMSDSPPSARLTIPGAESGLAQRDELLKIEADATDDFGLKRVEVVVLSQDNATDLKTLLPAAPGSKGAPAGVASRCQDSFTYDLASLDPVSGDELQFQLVATDLRDQVTRSEAVRLTIGTIQKTREAQLAMRLKSLVSGINAQMDHLQQTRTSWQSVGRNYREDERDSQRPAFAVIQGRLGEFGRGVRDIGNQLVAESETNDVAEARFLYRLGSTISVWGEQQAEIMADSCRELPKATGTNVYTAFSRSRELFSRALKDLEQYKHVVTVLEAFYETDVLNTKCEGAQGRYKRALPVWRGQPDAQAQAALTNGPGLLATFYDGQQLNGPVLDRRVSLPRIENDSVANRKENWSVRYQGELNVKQAGDWTLSCTADDGVRLLVDGKSVLPDHAWSLHAATPYKADLPLSAGWHALQLEFFQASSEAKLQFQAAQKGQPLQDVPADWLRPPQNRARQLDPATNAVLAQALRDSLRLRVKDSLGVPATVPPLVAAFTNEIPNENLIRLSRDNLPRSFALATNLLSVSNWKPEDSQQPEADADYLTGVSKEALKLVREELEKYRWRYEGAAALKRLKNALDELHEINQELRRQPHNPKKERTEQEQAKVDLAKTWEKELDRAAAKAAQAFFETAKANEATLAARTHALTAAARVEKELRPEAARLAKTLDEPFTRDEMAGQVDQRLNAMEQTYRRLNEAQEHMNREQIAAEARKALPSARTFARAQATEPTASAALDEPYAKMQQGVEKVQAAQRVAGDYEAARRLETLAGSKPESAKGKETAEELRSWATRTENNPPSLAQTIPPPMQEQGTALEKGQSQPAESANELATPRLAMALESARLARQRDRRTAVAYELLGQDLGVLVQKPAELSAGSLAPLTERARALAGEKGEPARQAEIESANQRLAALSKESPNHAAVLSARLDELSTEAQEAAGNARKQQPLATELGEMAASAPHPVPWTEAVEPAQVAAGAAADSLAGIEAAPKTWEAYHEASQTLADAARQLRMDSALAQVESLNPYANAAADIPDPAAETAPSNQGERVQMDGATGKALTQPVPKVTDNGDWAKLAERLRQAIRSGGIENFSEEQQAAIRAYFEKLSSTP